MNWLARKVRPVGTLVREKIKIWNSCQIRQHIQAIIDEMRDAKLRADYSFFMSLEAEVNMMRFDAGRLVELIVL